MECEIVETDYFTLHALCDGIFAAIAKPGQGAWSNAGIIDLGEELLVFDSLSTPSAGRELRRQAESLTGKKVKYLINSHYHGDHVFGNQEFSDTTIISTYLTEKLCNEKNKVEDYEKEKKNMDHYLLQLKNQIDSTEDNILKASLINQYQEMSKVLDDLSQLQIVLPSLLFEEKLTISGANRTVELYCFGGGHSPSDTFMYLPKEKIAFMGDLATEDLHVPIYNPEEFLTILKRIKQIDINIIVPGHGRVATMTLCDTLIDYLSFMIQRAKEALQNKMSLEDFVCEFDVSKEYKEWKGVNGIKANLTTIYTCLHKS
ncbi:MBL fold metallo-hydrolase [Lysinibacillus sp. fls2-241-R2A-57]|uniref:MBL fold metallo-hydrolase n=1 Tax=Lysinibacillus sp. fls2-241-R2A-57 TaxID=3040292 RepID=UPI002557C2E2|nr:MBL fold metallo-hydrolase [Lysinibacillus sp. fls2-241-R2A-57]